MSTTPNPLATLKTDWSWMTHHLILVAVLASLVFGGVYYVNSIIERHDEANLAASKAVLAQVTQQTLDLKAQLAKDEAASAADRAANAARDAQQTAIITTLANTIAKRDAALQQQLQQNATLTAQQAADRLSAQYKAMPGEVKAVGDTVVVDLPVARDIVNTFDKLTATEANLVDKQKQLDATNVKLTDANANLAAADNNLKDAKAVIGKQDEKLTASVQVCKDQIKVINAKHRKRLMIVAIVSFVGGIFAGHAAGI